MAVNLVSLVMQFLTPSIVGKIASSLGVEQTLAQKAIGAAVPTILSGLAGAAAKPDGARSLAATISKQETGLLGNFASMLGGSAQSGLVSAGTSALTSLLGGPALGALAGAVSKFAGIGESPARSLLGMLAPVVLGTLGQQQKTASLDAKGLANLLAGQKENIAAAMPTGFSSLLSGTNLLDAVSGSLKSGAASVSPATAGAVGGAAKAAGAAAASGTAGRTAALEPKPVAKQSSLWLVALAALSGLLAWNWFSDQSRQAAMPPPSTTAMPATKIMVGTVDVGSQVASVIDELRTSLDGIKDVASARAALPKLNDVAVQLQRVQGMAMPAESKKALAGLAAAGLKTLEPMFTSVLAHPGVSPIAKPVIDTVKARLDALAKA